MEYLLSVEGLVALLTLTILEIVLGIDNIIFLSILVSKLPTAVQAKARTIGLSMALILRIVFLFAASAIAQLTTSLIDIPPMLGMEEAFGITGRDLIMLGGGLFLLGKATTELHSKLEGEGEHTTSAGRASFTSVIIQVVLLDLVFSIDSVITAIGLSKELSVMVIAVVIAMIVMQSSAGWITRFIEKHPSIKILALAFLMMVGFVLVADGLHFHVPKGYVYVSMAFSISVELLNLRFRSKRTTKPVALRNPPYGEH